METPLERKRRLRKNPLVKLLTSIFMTIVTISVVIVIYMPYIIDWEKYITIHNIGMYIMVTWTLLWVTIMWYKIMTAFDKIITKKEDSEEDDS